MKARRRFHGYCPPSRRGIPDRVILGSPDDYTSNLSGITVHFVTTGEANPLKEIAFAKQTSPMHSFDQDDESSVIEILETNKELQKAVLGIRRKNMKLHDSASVGGGIVTSLSYDSTGDQPSVKQPTRREISFFPTPEDDVGSLASSVNSDMDGLPQVEIETPESASLASALTAQNRTDPDESVVQQKPTDRDFQLFRVNYLIVTIAIMLADGLQGT